MVQKSIIQPTATALKEHQQNLKHKEDRTLPNSFHRASHYPDAKTRQEHCKKRKLQAQIPDEHKCKNPQQNIGQPNSIIQFIPEMQGEFNICKINMIHHINKIRDKTSHDHPQ